MLKDLAADGGTTSSEAVRVMIRTAYGRKFKSKIPGAEISPTIRAIINDIAGPAHFTAGNLANRTGLPLTFVTETLERLASKGVIDCVDHLGPLNGQSMMGESENWTYELKIPREQAFSRIEKAGWDLDEELRPKS